MSINKNTGRPISKNVDYFPHKCKDDKELTFIRYRYKSEGYEVFYRLQQALGDSDYHFINLNDELQRSMFYMAMKVKKEIVDGVIKTLVQLGWLDEETFNKGYLWSNKFIDSIRIVYINRRRQVPQKEDIYRDSTCRNTSIVEKSIEKKSKEKKSKQEKSKYTAPLSISEYEKLYPHKDLTSLNDYLLFDNSTHSGALKWCDRELKTKPITFDKTKTGLFKAWCSKCGEKQFPGDKWQLKKGSECCRVDYQSTAIKDNESLSEKKKVV